MRTTLTRRFVLAVLCFINLTAAQGASASKDTAMSQEELAVVEELTLARTKPLEYAKFIENYRRQFKPDGTVSFDGRNLGTQEGTNAVNEAIVFLKKVKPLSAIKGARSLALAARDHVKDTGPKGATGHEGTDGSRSPDRVARYGKTKSTEGENISYGPKDARAIVMQLIIDDGVAGRGHRANIFNPDFRIAGVAIGPHAKYGTMCVMDFADDVVEKRTSGRPGLNKK